MRSLFRASLALTLAAGLSACTDSAAPGGGAQINLNLATRGAATAPAPGLGLAPDTVTLGADVLVLQKVEIVLREIEFERQNDDSCDSLATDDDACEEFKAGPVLLDLPLGPGAERRFSVTVDTGTYDEIEFEIHKPEDDGDAADQAFLAQHPEFADVSIRVTGTFNGTPFTYTSDLSVEQELDLSPPLVVGESSVVEATLLVDVRTWFVNGQSLVDPATANKGGQNEGVVKNNIEQSLEAFEDDDRDGEDD